MSWLTRAAINVAIGVVTAIIMAVLALVFFQLGPWVEARWFPVIVDFKIERTMIIEGRLGFTFSYLKKRDCKLREVLWFRKAGEVNIPAMIVRLGDAPLGNRIVGRNMSVWWVIKDEPQAGAYQQLLNYECGWPWITRVLVGPVEIGPPK